MGHYESGLVSVIMPTYKRSEKLTRAIESILGQTYRNLELLLVNDNEPDDAFTAELKERIKPYEEDPRFKLILQERHINGAAARNVGIRQARGEYIAFLDDDDWWEANKLEVQVDELRKLPEDWGGVSCKFQFVNQQGEVTGKTAKYRDGHIYKDILFLLSDVTTCSLLLRHTALDQAGYFDETLRRHQDLQLLVNFTFQYKLKEVDEYLFNLDVSDGQNRPDGETLLKHKEKFFASVKPVTDTMSPSDRRCMHSLHNFEVGYVFLKAGEKRKGIRYCCSVFASPKAFVFSVKKVLLKLSTQFKK